MRKYEEDHYKMEEIQDQIYPWVKKDLFDSQALGGKHFSEKDAPIIAFINDLKIMFVIKRGEELYEVLMDSMLPPETDILALYQKACENLARDVEFVVGNTMYGAFGILADGMHEASSLCLQSIWTVCAEKLQDDLVIAVPRKDTVLFAARSDEKALEKMRIHTDASYEQGEDKISTDFLIFEKDTKELKVYEAED